MINVMLYYHSIEIVSTPAIVGGMDVLLSMISSRTAHLIPVSSAEPLSAIRAASDFVMNFPSVVSISSTF